MPAEDGVEVRGVELGIVHRVVEEDDVGPRHGSVVFAGDAELDEEDGKAAVVLVAVEVLGECGAAVLMNGLQPVSATMRADTAIANQIRFGFTSKLLYLLVI